MKGVFDPTVCSHCPYKLECRVGKTGGERVVQRRVIYIDQKKILAHKRMANMENLDEQRKYSRANVEATVKEMKRGMKNGKVRIRSWSRISPHMIFTALAINFTRIHKSWHFKEVFDLLNPCDAMENLFTQCAKCFQTNLKYKNHLINELSF